MVIVARPSSASARLRGRGPGSMMAQPSRSPAAAARNTADSSSIPCGRISAEELGRLAVPDQQAAVDAEVQRVLQQDVQGRHAQQYAEDQRLGRDPDVVGPHLERERGRGVLRVVAAELVVDQAGRLRLASAGSPGRPGTGRSTSPRPARRPAISPRCPATTSAAGRPSPGSDDRREGADAAPGRGVRAADGRPRPGQPGRQPRGQRRVMARRCAAATGAWSPADRC